jgi:hypothetical protein
VFEAGSAFCQLIDVRRCEICISVQAEITPALIVRQDDEHVRLCGNGGDIQQQDDNDHRDEAKGSAHGGGIPLRPGTDSETAAD